MADGVLAGRNALVTGGAQGLGAGMAKALAAAGAKVMIGDMQDALGDRQRDRRRSRPQLDVTDEASWEAAVTTTVEQLGGLDILVNNAGIEISGLIVDAEAADISACSRSTSSARRWASSTGCARCDPTARRATAARSSTSPRSRRRSPSPASAATRRRSRPSTGSRGSPPSRPASSASACASTASIPGLVPTQMGKQLAVDMAELGLFASPEAAVGAVDRADPARASRRGRRHGRRGRLPRVRAGALHHGHRPARRRRNGDVAKPCPRSSTTWTRARRSAATRRAWSRASARCPTARYRTSAGRVAGALAASGVEPGGKVGILSLQRRDRVRVRVRDRPPRRGLVPDQPAQRGGREPRAARALRLRVPALPLRLRGHGGQDREQLPAAHDGLPRRSSSDWLGERRRGRAGRPAGRPGDARRHGRHDRPAEGRDAHRPQPRDDDRADADGLPVQRPPGVPRARAADPRGRRAVLPGDGARRADRRHAQARPRPRSWR